jgi:hypothetical protein
MEHKVHGLRLGNGSQRRFIAVHHQYRRGNGPPCRANDGRADAVEGDMGGALMVVLASRFSWCSPARASRAASGE